MRPENRLPVKGQHKAVKAVAKDTLEAFTIGINSDESIPFEERRLAYQQAVVQANERLKRLRARPLSFKNPGFSFSRTAKNTGAVAVSVAGVASSVGRGIIGTAGAVDIGPVTAVVGGVVGAYYGPRQADEMGLFMRADGETTRPTGRFKSTIYTTLLGVCGGFVAPSLPLCALVFKDEQKLGDNFMLGLERTMAVLNILNYSPRMRRYLNRPRFTKNEIADTTFQKLIKELVSIQRLRRPQNFF